MRRRNIFPDPECSGSVKAYSTSGISCDFVKAEGLTWMRATSTSVGTQQKYAQYSLTGSSVPPEGMYRISLLAHAEGGDGVVRGYVKKPDSSYMPVYAITAPDGQTVTVNSDVRVPAGCGELIVRICPADVIGANAMMSRISIESAETYALASGGGFRASSPQAPRLTRLKAGDRR